LSLETSKGTIFRIEDGVVQKYREVEADIPKTIFLDENFVTEGGCRY